MPRAGGNIAEQAVYHYATQPVAVVDEAPPVQNEWYIILEDVDIRGLFFTFRQVNDETAAKDIDIRWTLDGVVMTQVGFSAANNTIYCSYKSFFSDAPYVPTSTIFNMGKYTDIRCLAGKFEIRTTSVPGTNQVLSGRVVWEQLQET